VAALYVTLAMRGPLRAKTEAAPLFDIPHSFPTARSVLNRTGPSTNVVIRPMGVRAQNF
jgi:hypothetical protein